MKLPYTYVHMYGIECMVYGIWGCSDGVMYFDLLWYLVLGQLWADSGYVLKTNRMTREIMKYM